ncbi:MAG: hypothetical protein ACOC24_05385 [Desulfovibrionales bacterium]
MERTSWQVTVISPGKMYSGTVSVKGSLDRRTISLLNAASRSVQYTSGQNTLSPDGFLTLENVQLKSGIVEENLATLSIRKSEVVLVYDEFESMGSEWEKKRFEQGSFTNWQHVVVMTINRAGQWYRISGRATQLEQRLSGKDDFIPIAEANLERFTCRVGVRGVSSRRVPFVAVNKRFIETLHLNDPPSPKETDT